jgi:hypothetical protein
MATAVAASHQVGAALVAARGVTKPNSPKAQPLASSLCLLRGGILTNTAIALAPSTSRAPAMSFRPRAMSQGACSGSLGLGRLIGSTLGTVLGLWVVLGHGFLWVFVGFCFLLRSWMNRPTCWLRCLSEIFVAIQ